MPVRLIVELNLTWIIYKQHISTFHPWVDWVVKHNLNMIFNSNVTGSRPCSCLRHDGLPPYKNAQRSLSEGRREKRGGETVATAATTNRLGKGPKVPLWNRQPAFLLFLWDLNSRVSCFASFWKLNQNVYWRLLCVLSCSFWTGLGEKGHNRTACST